MADPKLTLEDVARLREAVTVRTEDTPSYEEWKRLVNLVQPALDAAELYLDERADFEKLVSGLHRAISRLEAERNEALLKAAPHLAPERVALTAPLTEERVEKHWDEHMARAGYMSFASRHGMGRRGIIAFANACRSEAGHAAPKDGAAIPAIFEFTLPQLGDLWDERMKHEQSGPASFVFWNGLTRRQQRFIQLLVECGVTRASRLASEGTTPEAAPAEPLPTLPECPVDDHQATRWSEGKSTCKVHDCLCDEQLQRRALAWLVDAARRERGGR